jgi:sarcosine oxidase gamma subunit
MNDGYSICDHHHDKTCNACLEEARREERQRAAGIMRRLLRWAGPDGYAITNSVEDSDDMAAARAYIAEAEAKP